MVDIMQIISLLVNIYISFTERKNRIYVATFLLNFALLLMYYFNYDVTTALIYIVITLRSLLYIYKDSFKTNIFPYIVVAIQLFIGYFTIENSRQILSILIPCYSTWYLWFYKDTQKLRVGNIIANTAWAVYNLLGGLYIVLIMRIITALSNIIAYIKHRNTLKIEN